MAEIWKKCPSFEGYEVSDTGRVRSKRGFLKTYLHSGMLRIGLMKNSRQKDVAVKNLVFEAFVGPVTARIEQIDGDAYNCSIQNLRLKPPKEKEVRHPVENLPGEKWNPVPEYEQYQVSSLGRVKRRRLLRPRCTQQGYLSVNLCKNSRCKTFRVHRLVLLSFIGPSDLLALHKNGDKVDNRLENLYYGTPVDNWQDTIKHGYTPPKGHPRPVANDQGQEFPSVAKAAHFCGVASGSISRAIRENNRSGGFYWKYI